VTAGSSTGHDATTTHAILRAFTAFVLHRSVRCEPWRPRYAASYGAHQDQSTHFAMILYWQEVVAAEKAGDRAGADAARAELLRVYRRDPVYLYVRSRLAKPAAPRTTS